MGWSKAHKIVKTADHHVESNYHVLGYLNDNGQWDEPSWYFHSWWQSNEWAWIYTNDTDLPVVVKSITFLACAGHSNGKYFSGSRNGSPTLYADGSGCTFTSDMYVLGSDGKSIGDKKGVGNVVVPSIKDFNCWYNGQYGAVDTVNQSTSFGNVRLFGPNTSYYKDRNGVSRCRELRTITYTDAPVVPVGGKMFVIIRPTSWESSQALLVMQGSGDNFDSVIEPVDESYIWVCLKKPGDASPKWYKEKKAFLKTNTNWIEM